MRLDEFLNKKHIPFQRLNHTPVYTANRMAQILHVPGREVAKTVLLRAGRGYALAVLPATHRVDLDRMRDEFGGERVQLAAESDMDRLFPDCERGAIPPFGSLYDVPTYVDDSLAQDKEIVFEGQNHEEAIRMSYQDFLSVEHPQTCHFAWRS